MSRYKNHYAHKLFSEVKSVGVISYAVPPMLNNEGRVSLVSLVSHRSILMSRILIVSVRRHAIVMDDIKRTSVTITLVIIILL